MTELKPCPFCGGKAIIMDMGYPHWIYCDQCGAKVHGRTFEEKDSIEAWNRRVGAPSKKGEWKKAYADHEALGVRPSFRYCSECCEVAGHLYNYCPNCGADMRVDTDD